MMYDVELNYRRSQRSLTWDQWLCFCYLPKYRHNKRLALLACVVWSFVLLGLILWVIPVCVIMFKQPADASIAHFYTERMLTNRAFQETTAKLDHAMKTRSQGEPCVSAIEIGLPWRHMLIHSSQRQFLVNNNDNTVEKTNQEQVWLEQSSSSHRHHHLLNLVILKQPTTQHNTTVVIKEIAHHCPLNNHHHDHHFETLSADEVVSSTWDIWSWVMGQTQGRPSVSTFRSERIIERQTSVSIAYINETTLQRHTAVMTHDLAICVQYMQDVVDGQWPCPTTAHEEL